MPHAEKNIYKTSNTDGPAHWAYMSLQTKNLNNNKKVYCRTGKKVHPELNKNSDNIEINIFTYLHTKFTSLVKRIII